MNNGTGKLWVVALALSALGLASAPAFSQTDIGMMNPTEWREGLWGQTVDKIILESKADVSDGGKAEMFYWDSVGKFRFDKDHPDQSSAIGYRYYAVGFNHESPVVPKQLQKIELAGGLHLGKVGDGELSTVIGMGYQGDKPFANPGGSLTEIAHLIWTKRLSDNETLQFTADYYSGGSFLPDIPLPGFAYSRRCDNITFTVGYPRDLVAWKITDRLTLLGQYMVPFSAEAYLDYRLADHWSIFANAAKFYEAFNLNHNQSSNRYFQDMNRIEGGIHYFKHDFWHGQELDIALILGYAFDQDFHTGFDARSTHQVASFSDEPYIGIILRGAL